MHLISSAEHLGFRSGLMIPTCLRRLSADDAGSQRVKVLTLKAPNTTIAEFANTVDPDEMAHNEPSHLDLQCLPS